MLLSEPPNYLVTRLQDVAEIVVFFGPYLGNLFLRGLFKLRVDNPDLFWLTALGILSLIAMLAAGMFGQGETARICLPIYPYLLFPIVYYLEKNKIGPKEEIQVATLVFGQAVLMQSFGRYFW